MDPVCVFELSSSTHVCEWLHYCNGVALVSRERRPASWLRKVFSYETRFVKSVECPVRVPNEILCHAGTLQFSRNNYSAPEIEHVCRTVPAVRVKVSI